MTRPERVAILGVLAVAAASCAIGLARRPLWADESLSVGATTQLVDTWEFTGGTMAAYYALLTPWASISHDRAWLRALSVVLALAVLPVVHRLARRLGDRFDAVLSTVLLAGSWAFVRYAQEARSYALAMLLTTASWAVLVRWARSDPSTPEARRSKAAYTALIVLALFSHGLTGLQVVAQAVAVGLLPDGKARIRALLPSFFVCIAALGLLTMVGAAEVANWIPPLSLDQLRELVEMFTGPSAVAQIGIGVGLVVGAVVALRTFRRPAPGQDGWLHGVVLVWALLPPVLLVMLSLARPYLLPRYVLGSLPALSILLMLATRPLRDRKLQLLAVLALGALLVAGRVSLHRAPYDDWAAMARAVATEAQPDDVIAFPTQTLRPTFDYAWWELEAPVTPEVISPTGPLGVVRRIYPYYGDDVVPDRLADAAPPRIWVIGAETIGRGDTVAPFLADPALVDYRVELRQRFDGGLEAVLLVRR